MEFIIFYFSGTGNTELISRELSKNIEQQEHTVELVSIEDKDRIEKIDLNNKIIGFGYPVYKFTFPDNFVNLFLVVNENANNCKFFQFCTYARFSANVFSDFSKKINSKTIKLIAEKSFKSPSNGISARKQIDDYEYKTVMFFEDNISNEVEVFANEIIENAKKGDVNIKQKRSNILAPLKLMIVKDIEATKYPKLQIDRDKCIMCGLCAAKCPDDNLENIDGYIKIIDDKHCLHCLRCMHHCSSNAIIFGKLTKGENRYTLKCRNQMFEKSSKGYKDKYWVDFEETRTIWRQNTIKYWWNNRWKPEIE